jgi:hypothetical protein
MPDVRNATAISLKLTAAFPARCTSLARPPVGAVFAAAPRLPGVPLLEHQAKYRTFSKALAPSALMKRPPSIGRRSPVRLAVCPRQASPFDFYSSMDRVALVALGMLAQHR